MDVSTKCACVDKWLLNNGLEPMATVPSKSSVTLSTDLRGCFKWDSVQFKSPGSEHQVKKGHVWRSADTWVGAQTTLGRRA